MIRDLKRKNIKFVLVQNKHWTNHIDGISNEERLPKLFRYVRNNYKFFQKIDDQEIWIRYMK